MADSKRRIRSRGGLITLFIKIFILLFLAAGQKQRLSVQTNYAHFGGLSFYRFLHKKEIKKFKKGYKPVLQRLMAKILGREYLHEGNKERGEIKMGEKTI